MAAATTLLRLRLRLPHSTNRISTTANKNKISNDCRYNRNYSNLLLQATTPSRAASRTTTSAVSSPTPPSPPPQTQTQALLFSTRRTLSTWENDATAPKLERDAAEEEKNTAETDSSETTTPHINTEDVIRRRMCDLIPKYREMSTNYVARKNAHKKLEVDPDTQYELTVSKLLAAGLHFGHHEDVLHESNVAHLFGVRHGTHIINLELTISYLRRAAHFVREVAMEGGTIVFVGTKVPEIGRIAMDAARKCDSYYVSKRWVGGTLTNSYNVLRRHNPPETVPIEATTYKQQYKLYEECERPGPTFNQLVAEARKAYRLKTTGVGEEKVLSDVRQGLSDEEFDYLMMTVPDPEISEAKLKKLYPDESKLGGISPMMWEKARMIGYPDDDVLELPEHIKYRLRSGPIDPAGDPNYDVEEDLYLTPEQIRQKKEEYIRARQNETAVDEKNVAPHRPDLVICLNPQFNAYALKEATVCGIPTVGIIDTDIDARSVTYPIPANDDSHRGIALIANVLSCAVAEGKEMAKDMQRATDIMRARGAARRARPVEAVQRKYAVPA